VRALAGSDRNEHAEKSPNGGLTYNSRTREGTTMASGTDLRGQVAKTMAGADRVEIKATIPQKQIKLALDTYGLSLDGDERYVYFFDTPDLELFETGVIARARRNIGSEHDSTIKFRPVDPSSVPELWRKYAGFKIEADATEKGVVKSASLTLPVAKGLIKRVAAGDEPIASLYTQDQLLFLFSLANRKLDYTKVVAMGPMRAWKWKYNHPGLPWPITGELWQRQDGARVFEVSIKVPVVQAAAACAGFMAFLAEVGAERDMGQQAKTRWALEHAVKELRGKSVPPGEVSASPDGAPAGRRSDRSKGRAAIRGR
jgi:hypothetical protein